MSSVFTFEIGRPTIDLLEELKVAFGVQTDVQVLKRALALAKICTELADENGVVTFVGRDGRDINLMLRDPMKPARSISTRMRRLVRVLRMIPRALR